MPEGKNGMAGRESSCFVLSAMRPALSKALAVLLASGLCGALLPNSALAATEADGDAPGAATATQTLEAQQAAVQEQHNKEVSAQARPAKGTSISKAKIELYSSSIVYDGDVQEPGFSVMLGDWYLFEGRDYTVRYSNNVNAGTATITLTGKGDYTGTAKKTFKIQRASISNNYLSVNDYYVPFTGKGVKPGVTISKFGKTLKNGRDYTLTYRNNVKGGTATVTATGKGNFTGSTSSTFKVQQPRVKYCTHVQTYGWQGYRFDGATSGTSGKSKRLEGIRIQLVDRPYDYSGNILYRTHVQTYGWEKRWSQNGWMSGTSGQAKRLEAIQIKLDGDMREHYDIYYRVHAQKFGWMGWAKNGQQAGTAGYAYRLEAIQIKIVPKGMPAPGKTTGAFKQKRR